MKTNSKCAGFVGTGTLLERQLVVFCPNIGVLSTSVLSLVPLLRPFAWQSLLLPVLPALDKMLDLLEAPVPFILGIQVRRCILILDSQDIMLCPFTWPCVPPRVHSAWD